MEKTAHDTKIVMCSSRLCLICFGLLILSLLPESTNCTQVKPDLYDIAIPNNTDQNQEELKQIVLPSLNSSEEATATKRNFFISKLFERFGNDEGIITHDGLDQLLQQLGFKGDQHNDHINPVSKEDQQAHSADVHDHDEDHTHNASESHTHSHIKEKLSITIENNSLEKEKLDLTSLLQIYGYSDQSEITKNQFVSLCPGFLFMMVGQPHADHVHYETPLEIAVSDHPLPKVWGFSCLALLITSLIGLFSVAVIPLMQKVFYNHLLQFLVALGVGALSGDVMLHLIPHAFTGGQSANHDNSEHTRTVMKGLCGLCGIYFFFLVERLLTIHTQQKWKKNKGEAIYSNNKTVYNEETTTSSMSHARNVQRDEPDCEGMVMGIHPGHKALKNYAEESHNTDCNKIDSIDDEKQHINCNNTEEEEPHLVLSHTHGGHGHSHCHNVPKTISAIAWMVILGDGIHNFSDGLAIGAAFANSITGGFSTAIAIFCHELPHEIGDFAVLLRAGMSIKQILVYNCVSSILAFLGMPIGVFIGNIEGASLWIFVAVAGMFLYIALVDMLPQVSEVDTKKGEHPLYHLLLQISGMLLGGGIMLLIALFEHDLKIAL